MVHETTPAATAGQSQPTKHVSSTCMLGPSVRTAMCHHQQPAFQRLATGSCCLQAELSADPLLHRTRPDRPSSRALPRHILSCDTPAGPCQLECLGAVRVSAMDAQWGGQLLRPQSQTPSADTECHLLGTCLHTHSSCCQCLHSPNASIAAFMSPPESSR
jgi:hypothetical protein